MQCDFCSNEASIEISLHINGQTQAVHLCSSCYRKKMNEIASSLPDQWGGRELAKQIQSMLDHEGFPDQIPRTIELHFAHDQLSPEESLAFQSFVSQKLMEPMETEDDQTGLDELTGRGSAFTRERKSLLKQREIAVERLENAMDHEDYENCAEYRDRIAKIGDALVRLNEERKDLHGV